MGWCHDHQTITPKTAAASPSSQDLSAEIGFLTRAFKALTMGGAVTQLEERARVESWSHDEFLVACPQREVATREWRGGEGRIRAAGSYRESPWRSSTPTTSAVSNAIAHLGTLDFVVAEDNIVFLGPPGTRKTHLAIGIAIRARQAGHRLLFTTASGWVARLAEAHHAGPG